MTKQYRFSATHRLHAPGLGDEQNRTTYGKCNNPFGHGHDYVLQVRVRAGAVPETGTLAEAGVLDALVERRVLASLRDADLNQWAGLGGAVPTTENLAAAIEARLAEGWAEAFPVGPEMDAVRILETPRNIVEARRA